MKYLSITVILLLLLTIVACKESKLTPEFSYELVELKSSEATIIATFDNSSKAEKQGVIYSKSSNIEYKETPLHNEIIIQDETADFAKTYTLDELEGNTYYYFKLFSIIEGEVFLSDVYSFITPCHGLGCGPAGGPIVWEDGNGGGIEVANNFITTEIAWGCEGINVSTSIEIGSGEANTLAIINDCGTETLAQKCVDYSQNGFNDYYMPSQKELEMIFFALMVNSDNPFNYPEKTILSSSQSGENTCIGTSFITGSNGNYSKSTIFWSTIPVRSF